MIPLVKKSKFEKAPPVIGMPDADYSKFNQDPETFKTDRENGPYSPALIQKMKTAQRDKDGWTVKPRSKPTRKP